MRGFGKVTGDFRLSSTVKGAPAHRSTLPFRLAGALFCLLAALALPAAAQDPEFRIGPAPDWIVPIEDDPSLVVPGEGTSDGVFYVLSDMQLLEDPAGPVRYNRFVQKAIASAGLDEVAHLEIDFDPSFQTLELHHVDVIRAGRRMPRLAQTEVKLIQREKELEYRIYDGRKTAALFLEDVRVGDLVDYGYSVRGQNPAFAGAIFGETPMQWAVPVGIDHTRMLVPVGRRVEVESRNGAPEPSVRQLGAYREYRWLQHGVAPLRSESGSPPWLDLRAHARWSEFRDWAAVARWAAPLYAATAPLGAELEAEAARMMRENATPEARTAAVLRFVQSEIRYLGVEVGIGSYRPNPPDTVFARRFGDCKDKTLLMLALLARMDIEALPALVHSDLGRGLSQALVAPVSFNHVIVRARVGDRDYWLDPTFDMQPGRLDRLFQPDYGSALLISPATESLVAMHPERKATRRMVAARLDARKGMDEPATLTVTTTMEYGQAESMRATLAADPREKIEKDYLNFYSNYYRGLRSTGPMDVSDDPEENRIVLVEHYEIDGFWAPVEDGLRKAVAYSPEMYDLLKPPSATRRQMPLAIGHPVDFTLTTEVLLHDDWPIEDEDLQIRSPGFVFERSISGHEKGRRVVLVDRYRSLAHEIAAEAAPDHAAKLEQASDNLGFEFSWRPDVAGGGAGGDFNWIIAMLSALLLTILMAAATFVYRHDPAGPVAPLDPSLQGIRGWLILPAIGVVVTPIRVGLEFIGNLEAYGLSNWAALVTPGGEFYHALWAPLLLFELCVNLGLIVLSVLLLVMFFQRRRLAPMLFIVMIVGSALFAAVDLWLANMIPMAAEEITAKDGIETGRACLYALIWTAYFLVSRRVKSTFIRARRGAPAAAVEPPPLPAT